MTHTEDQKTDFKWPIVVADAMGAPARRVWDVISKPGNLEACHPFCLKNPVKVWPGDESRDAVHYLSGWVFERRFCRWIDGVGYDLYIGRTGGRSSFVSWRILPDGDQNSDLRIAVYPFALQNLPVAIRWLPHHIYLRPMLKSYLLSVVGGVQWFLSRGEPVPRNQFGGHPWFSVPKRFDRAA